jgi:hypothetical protein
LLTVAVTQAAALSSSELNTRQAGTAGFGKYSFTMAKK